MSIEWQLVAGGFLDFMLADYLAVTSKDARILLINDGAFIGKTQRACFDSLSWVPPVVNVQGLSRFIAEPHTNPHIHVVVPMVANAQVSGDQITCDAPGEGYVTDAYSWNFVEFSLIGPLLSQPSFAAGTYVLVNRRESDNQLGLPSLYLAVS